MVCECQETRRGLFRISLSIWHFDGVAGMCARALTRFLGCCEMLVLRRFRVVRRQSFCSRLVSSNKAAERELGVFTRLPPDKQERKP